MKFQKGQSGNPGGRPKENEELKQLARAHTKEAVERLLFWLRSEDATASVRAAQTLLDRGYGKPHQSLDVTGDLVTSYVMRAPDQAEDSREWEKRFTPKGGEVRH